jgi:hypothetical protein
VFDELKASELKKLSVEKYQELSSLKEKIVSGVRLFL